MTVSSTLRQSERVQSSQGFDELLSKAVVLGNDYRIIMRVIEDGEYKEFPIPADAGRSLDYNVFGPSWVSYPEGGLEELNNGHFRDLTVLNMWARVARILLDAEYTYERRMAEIKANAEAEVSKKPIDEAALAIALKDLELKYKGGEKSDGDKVKPEKFPIIGSIQIAVVAQAYIIKYDADKKEADWENSKVISFRCSKDKINELKAGLKFAQKSGLPYVEFAYSYTGKDKQSAGRKAKLEVVKEEENSLAHMFPEAWEREKDRILSSLSTDENVILSKSSAISSTITIDEVVSKMKAYCAKNVGILSNVDLESEDVKKNAEFMLDNNIFVKTKDIIPKLEEIVAKKKEERADKEEDAAVVTEAENAAINAANKIKNADEDSSAIETLAEVLEEVDEAAVAEDHDIEEIEVPNL